MGRAVLGLLALSGLAACVDSQQSQPEYGLGGGFSPQGFAALKAAMGEFNTSACANWPLLLPGETSLSPAVEAAVASIPGYLKKNVVPNQDFSGYAYAVTYKTRTLTSGGGGNVNMTGDSPSGRTSRFFIGSITKVFTSHLAFILHSKGKLNLEMTLPEMDPGIGDAYQHITLSMLLSHLAGTVRRPPCTNELCNMTTEYVVHKMNQDVGATLKFPAAMTPMYSNYGFSLAGRLMEKITGVSYEEMLREHIWEPLGMINSGFYTEESDRSKFGTGYGPGGEPQPLPIGGWSTPAGYMYSTAEDMAAYVKQFSTFFHQPGAKYLIPEELTRHWLKPAFNFPGGEFASGHPWEIFKMDGMWLNTKGGVISGYISHILVVPNLGLGVFYSQNGNANSLSVGVAGQLAAIVGKPLAQNALALSRAKDSPKLPSDASLFVGKYTTVGRKPVRIVIEDGVLVGYTEGIRSVLKQKLAVDPTGSTWEFWSDEPWSAPCDFPIFWGGDLEPLIFGPKKAGVLRTSLRVPGMDPVYTWRRTEE